MEVYAFTDAKMHYFLRIGTIVMERAPFIKIVNSSPRMRTCFKKPEDYQPIVESFLNAGLTYGGDPLAIQLLMEQYNMAKIVIVDTLENCVVAVVGSNKKAEEYLEEHVANTDLVALANEDDFNSLTPECRIEIAKTDAAVAEMPADEQVKQAYKVALKFGAKAKEAAKAAPKPERKLGVQSQLRVIFAHHGAAHTLEELMELTGGTKVSVITALGNLRSPTYCGLGGVLSIYAHADKKFRAGGKEAANASGEADRAALAALKEQAKAEKEAAKAAKAAEKAAEKEAAKAAKAAGKAAAELEAAAEQPAV